MSANLERRLVAVMFTDMVGYTALLQADEQSAVEKRERYVAALERYHDELGGTIVQRLGDGSMSMFPSALAAAQAGVAIQQELAAQDVSVRVGIHVGEVIVEPERLTGNAVNIAARIESFAAPGSGDALGRRVRAAPEPQRHLGRPARRVSVQERRQAVRALRGRRGGPRRARSGDARGQG